MSDGHAIELLWLKHPVFAAAGPDVCLELARRFPATAEAEDAPLFAAGEPARHLFVVLDGTVRLFHAAADGRQVTVKLLRAPNTAGTLEILHQVPRLIHAAVVEPSLVARIPAEAFVEFLQLRPAACFALVKHMAAAFLVAARNEQQVFASLASRVANLLLSYGQYYGSPAAGGVVIDCPLSQQMIAEGVGSIRRSVAGLMAEWRHQGLLTKRRGKIVLVDVGRLAELAGVLRDSICYQAGMTLEHLPGSQRLPRARLEVTTGPGSVVGRSVQVGAEVRVGRSESCQLPLADELVSLQHCRVFLAATGGRYWVEDLQSENGTLLNGKGVQRAVLKDGDLIQLGATRLVLRLG